MQYSLQLISNGASIQVELGLNVVEIYIYISKFQKLKRFLL